MSISVYLKEIGRGREGARALSRAQASDLMGQILDGQVSDLELGAFCLAMRMKGESADEMAGFLDSTHQRLKRIAVSPQTRCVIIPSYNGARKLPCLTALLAALLAREGVAVVVHGTPTESARITTQNIWETLNWPTWGLAAPDAPHANALQAGQMVFIETASLNAQLKKLLDVRRTIGLRNSAHSLVKLMNPSDQTNALLISSYTHPEYALSMAQTLRITHQRALLLRGTEGECVADVRRQPQMDAWYEGQSQTLIHAQQGPLKGTPDLPSLHAQETARYIQAVLAGDKPTPEPIAQQVRATLTAFDL